MSETLVIRLRAADDAPASWLVVDSNGAPSGPVHSGPLADALNDAIDRRVVLLLPGSEITLAEPELPLRGGARLAQAVPFALEEQLASDVETLHFAVGSRVAGSTGTPVAIVARAALDRWLATCEAAGIQPTAAFADTTMLPPGPASCTLLLDEPFMTVRRATGLPYVLDAEPLTAALELALGDPVASAETGEHLAFYTMPAQYERHQDLIEGLRERVGTLQVKLLPDGPLPLLAPQALAGASTSVNLLQGPYAPRSSFSNRTRRWRLPASLAAAAALLFVATQAVSLWQLGRAEKTLDGEIAEVFAQALPGQPIVDPRAQMQGVIASGGASSGGFLPVISVLAEAMSQAPAARIEAMSFRSGALELRLTAPSVESLDGIKQAMTRDGITVDLQSATPRGSVFEGRLQVRLGKA